MTKKHKSNPASCSNKRPKVGVGVVIAKNGKVLLGKRKKSPGMGTWCFPGGHLEFGETVKEGAIRETKEETRLKIFNLKIGPYTNDIFKKDNKHYITLFVTAQTKGEPQVLEPDKCETWLWFDWDELPKPLFLPVKQLQESGFRI